MSSTIAPSDPTTALLDAVQQIRKARHHIDCRCFMYRKDGAAYCNEQEAWWNHCVSRLLDNYLALR